jgi:hypothetical protein
VTVDGDTVYTQSDIPDSAIHQWFFDEGSGTTVEDEVGTLDGAINGASWSSDADLEGGWGLSFGGNNDEVDFARIDSEVTVSGVSYSIAMTINPDDISNRTLFYEHQQDNFDRVMLGTNSSEVFFNLYDGGQHPKSTGTGPVGSNRMRVCATYDGTVGNHKIWIDGSDETNATAGGTGDSNLQNGHKIGLSASQDGDFPGIIDHPIIYDSELSASEVQQDYDAQPWS